MNEKVNYENFILNAVVDDKVFDTTKVAPSSIIYGRSKSKAESLPSEYSRPVVVPVFNQGRIGSCVGASGKIVVTDRHYPKNNLSALWIYKRAKQHDEWSGEDYSGTSIGGACKALVVEGVCGEDFYPYIDDETSIPKGGASEDAATRKFEKYWVLTFSEPEKIKRLIMQESLWTSFDVHREFYKIDKNGFLLNEGNYLSSENIGGHAVALVGWKEVNGKLFWRFQNSWGSFFGHKGFFYISNDLYSNISKGVFFLDSFTEKDPTPTESNVIKSVGFLQKLLDIPKKIFERIMKIFKH
jgi:hypothetical protein